MKKDNKLNYEMFLSQNIGREILNYMREHSDIDARKYKFNNLLNDLVCKGILEKFIVKYSESNLATAFLWTTPIPVIFPEYTIAFDLNIKSEDIPE